MADNEAIMKKLEEQDSLIRRLTLELNRLTKGKGVADDGASGGAAGRNLEDDEVYIELGAEVPSRRRQRREDDVAESALLQVFKKAKLSEFDGEKKTGEDLEAWLEELEDFFALREFDEVGKAKIAALQLRGVAKLWWKSHVQIRQRQDQPITWAEFKTAAEKRYCSPHYYLEKKMEFYNFK